MGQDTAPVLFGEGGTNQSCLGTFLGRVWSGPHTSVASLGLSTEDFYERSGEVPGKHNT